MTEINHELGMDKSIQAKNKTRQWTYKTKKICIMHGQDMTELRKYEACTTQDVKMTRYEPDRNPRIFRNKNSTLLYCHYYPLGRQL